jgi:hypothetical protein
MSLANQPSNKPVKAVVDKDGVTKGGAYSPPGPKAQSPKFKPLPKPFPEKKSK